MLNVFFLPFPDSFMNQPVYLQTYSSSYYLYGNIYNGAIFVILSKSTAKIKMKITEGCLSGTTYDGVVIQSFDNPSYFLRHAFTFWYIWNYDTTSSFAFDSCATLQPAEAAYNGYYRISGVGTYSIPSYAVCYFSSFYTFMLIGNYLTTDTACLWKFECKLKFNTILMKIH